MRGGSLCEGNETFSLDPLFQDGNRYEFGENLGEGDNIYEKIHLEKNDENIVIKFFYNYYNGMNEGYILNKLNDCGFTPKYYGTYSCYRENQSSKPVYVVMERIKGYNLLDLLFNYLEQEKINKKEDFNKTDTSKEFIDKYIDEIYQLYNLLMDRGIIHTDLYLQNIILNNPRDKLYFIDFEYAKDIGEYIPPEKRLSQEQLFKNLLKRKPIYEHSITGGKKRKNFKKTKKRHKKNKISKLCYNILSN